MNVPPSPSRPPVPDRPPDPAPTPVHAGDPEFAPHAVPRGTLLVIATLLLALTFLWMLAQGVLQGRA